MSAIDPEKLNKAMDGQGVTAAHLADATGKSLVYIRDIISGRRNLKRNPELRKAAAGVSVCGFIQDPTEETLRQRDLFTHRVGGRLENADVIDPLLGDGARDVGAVLDKIPKTTFGVGYRTTNEQPKPVRVRSVCPTNSEISELNARLDGVVAKHPDLLEVPQTWRTIVSRVRRVVRAWLLEGPRQRIEGAGYVMVAVWLLVEFFRYLETFGPVANSPASSDPEHGLLIANATLVGNAHFFVALALLTHGLFKLVRPLGTRPWPVSPGVGG